MPSPTPSPRDPTARLTTRREFVVRSTQALGLLALTQLTNRLYPAEFRFNHPARRVLVVVQLVGGNDGLNTIIPLDDEHYRNLRPTLAVNPKRILPLDEQWGFHPACAGLRDLSRDGRLTVVHNVGYPQPSRSHFRAAAVWASGNQQATAESTGWLGRYLDLAPVDSRDDEPPPMAVYLTPDAPACLRQASPSARSVPLPPVAGGFEAELRQVAEQIAQDGTPSVYVLSLAGFDTHSHQANPHANLLCTLSRGLKGFQQALAARGLDRSVLTLTVSEFGRSVAENGARGTDHGTAAPLFLMGPEFASPVFGTPPELGAARFQDVVATTDFRQVYATVLEHWLGGAADTVLETSYEKLALFPATHATT